MSTQPWGVGWLPTNPDRCSCGRSAIGMLPRSDGQMVGHCGIDDVDPLEPCLDVDCPLNVNGTHDRMWCAERLAMPRRMHAECLICDATTQPLPHEIVPPRGTP